MNALFFESFPISYQGFQTNDWSLLRIGSVARYVLAHLSRVDMPAYIANGVSYEF
jgi:hypothetical protein